MVKIGAIVIVNCDKDGIWYCLRGIYSGCDKIVVVHSGVNWNNEPKDDGTLDILKSFKDPGKKLILVQKDETSQPAQRTIALDILREEGFDYCFVVDSDEIYHPEQAQWAHRFIEESPGADIYRVRWTRLWKNLQYKLVPDDAELSAFYRIADDFSFTQARGTTYKIKANVKSILLDPSQIVCYHLTAVCDDNQMLEKIKTRTYKNRVVKNWYKDKWLNWTPDSKDLHPVKPDLYKKAVLFDKAKLPKFMETHRFWNSK